MTDYIRRLVSGNKARFKDEELNLELDLVYVTDQVIIMGYPASGMEGFYRNRREDAIRFLEHRHGKNFWVFNFCPIKENSYDASVFGGRVSRYPFPDHHAPPLSIMPLVAREMHAWLKGSPERVAVLHCKAGKGRSGTMACTYLLSHEDNATPPQQERNYTAKEWAKKRTATTIDTLPPDNEQAPLSAIPPTASLQKDPLFSLHENAAPSDIDGILEVEKGAPPTSASSNPERSFTDALKGVLDLHTARRMKQPSEKDAEKVKQGVSIPSQRRFLYYWALLLAHDAPKHLWSVKETISRIDDPKTALPLQKADIPRPKVRLTQLRLRMRDTSSMKLGIVKAANKVIEKTSRAKGPTSGSSGTSAANKEREKSPTSSSSQVWASLARYDDALVNVLEDWEVFTRDPEGNMGKRRHGSEHLIAEKSTKDEVLGEIFNSGKWDKGKMVRSFARLGVTDGTGEEKTIDDTGGKFHIYTLKPLSDKRWEGLMHDINKNANNSQQNLEKTLEAIEDNATAAGVSQSEANSMYDVTTVGLKLSGLEQGVILDAGREIRVKLYMGQVFMGWLWFIPTFHMPQPPPSSSSSSSSPASLKTTLSLSRKDVDFPLGIGSAIIDIDIEMEWVVPPPATMNAIGVPPSLAADGEIIEPPVRARTEDTQIGLENEPAPTGIIAAAVQAAVSGGETGVEGLGSVGVREAVEAKQGATD